MKAFKLYLGGSGCVGTYEITLDPSYKIVVEMVQQLRTCLLSNQDLRKPLLLLFETVYGITMIQNSHSIYCKVSHPYRRPNTEPDEDPGDQDTSAL